MPALLGLHSREWSHATTRRDEMTKLDAALLKLEGALDQTIDPRVRSLIDVAQQAIEEAKQVMVQRPHMQDCDGVACLEGYQQAA